MYAYTSVCMSNGHWRSHVMLSLTCTGDPLSTCRFDPSPFSIYLSPFIYFSFHPLIYWIYWCKYIHLLLHLPIDFQSSISSFIHDPIFSLCQKPGAARLRMTQQHRHKWRCDSDTSAAQCGKQKRFVWVTLGKVQNPSPLPNVQKWSEHNVLVTFWLRNVLRATTACTFSTSWLPKVVREWCVLMCILCILTSFDFE